MLYIDSELRFLNLSNEQIGRIIKKLILENDFQEVLNDIETSIYNELKAKNDKRKDNIKQINIKGWQKRKAEQTQKEKTQKGDLQKREITQKQYNKPFPSVTNKNNKSTFTNDYLKTGVIKL